MISPSVRWIDNFAEAILNIISRPWSFNGMTVHISRVKSRWPFGNLGSDAEAQILAGVQAQCPNLVPTTYEAPKAYLDEEILKPGRSPKV